MTVPVIAIDGPSGAGKGTVAKSVADALGYHLLDSGAVYRSAALHACRVGADLADETAVLAAMDSLNVRFEPSASGVQVYFGEEEISSELRTEATAAGASKVAVMPGVRARLLPQQRSFRQAPGLVADGRDMGTVVFPDATLKVFLTASAEERARRRSKQLKEKGIDATMASLVADIAERDSRDSTRTHSPMVATADYLLVDSTSVPAEVVVAQIVAALASVTSGKSGN